MTDQEPDQPLVRSDHLDLFQRGSAIFVYHNLVGYILEMDDTVLELLNHFETPKTPEEATESFSDRWRPEEVENFVHIFRTHACLVPPDRDEEEELLGYHPVVGPWVVYYRESPTEVIVTCKHRRWSRIILSRLSRLQSRIWTLADGERTIQDIIEELEKSFSVPHLAEEVKMAIFGWVDSDFQLMKLSRIPFFQHMGRIPAYLRSIMPYEPYRGADDREPDRIDLRDYHREEIEDAAIQFDIEETTLSHMFRVPHPALKGRTYGGAFANKLAEEELLRPDLELLEVGGGVGFFCRSFLEALQEYDEAVYDSVQYRILDLSVVLQDSQRMLNLPFGERVRFVLGDAQRLPFSDDSLQIVLSNEVIADLLTVRLDREDLVVEDPSALPETRRDAVETIRRLGVECDDAPGTFHVNVGALKMVEEVARVLTPGGRAYLVEYGDMWKYPVESTHLNHSEFSIHFGHLVQAARTLGLEVELEDCLDFLDWDVGVKVLSTTRTHFQTLRALLARKGVRLEKIAYTEEMFGELVAGRFDLDKLHKLEFQPVQERALGLMPKEFKVLILQKPESPENENG